MARHPGRMLRRPGTPLAEAFAAGPLLDVGRQSVSEPGWHRFSADFDQPRVATESVRLLIDVEDRSGRPDGVLVRFDDLAWVEWSTPWLDGDTGETAPQFATHVQFRPKP